MKPIHTIASLLFLGTLAAVAACAQGTSDVDGTPLGGAPVKAKNPTEPPPPSVKVPGSSGDRSSSSSGESSSGESSSGESSTSSSGGSTSSSGGSTSSSGGSTSSSGGSTSSSGGSTSSSGGSTSSSSSSSSGGSSGTPGCTTVAPSNACGLTPQCGCAANQTCDVTTKTDGSVSCVTAGGGPQGSLCTTTNQCAVGLTCAYGACRPYCATANTACTGTGLGQCGQFYDPPGTLVPNSKVCTITCDLRSPSGACGSNTCIWDSGVKATDCDKAGTKGLYAACTSYNDCQQGMACTNHPIFGFECEKWCRVGVNSDCASFETCEDIYGANAPMQGATKLGMCQ